MMSEGERLIFDRHNTSRADAFLKMSPHRKVNEVVRVTIEDGGQVVYTIASRRTMLVVLEWCNIIRSGAGFNEVGKFTGCHCEGGSLPVPGTVLELRLNSRLWQTIASSFDERGVAKVTHLQTHQYHPDIEALLAACDQGYTVRIIFL
jgi:hypothetical protein